MREVVEYGIEFSQLIKQECEEGGIPYFDGSTDFEGAVHAAVSHFASIP